MSDYLELIARRQSCRSYDPQRPVEPEKLLNCLEAARLAPSARNTQPWYFAAVHSAEKRAELLRCIQDGGANGFADDAPCLVAVYEQPRDVVGALGNAAGKPDFRGIDVGLAVSQFCLEATQQGLSTCIIGWINAEKAKNVLGIDRHLRLVLALGYAKQEDALRPKKRKAAEEMSVIID